LRLIVEIKLADIELTYIIIARKWRDIWHLRALSSWNDGWMDGI